MTASVVELAETCGCRAARVRPGEIADLLGDRGAGEPHPDGDPVAPPVDDDPVA